MVVFDWCHELFCYLCIRIAATTVSGITPPYNRHVASYAKFTPGQLTRYYMNDALLCTLRCGFRCNVTQFVPTLRVRPDYPDFACSCDGAPVLVLIYTIDATRLLCAARIAVRHSYLKRYRSRRPPVEIQVTMMSMKCYYDEQQMLL